MGLDRLQPRTKGEANMIHRIRHLTLAALVVLTLLDLVGCGGDNGTNATASSCLATIGKACKSNSDCSGCAGGYCPGSGVCTRPCEGHEDCGCAAGTVNMDIEDGKCDVACGQLSGTVSGCMLVCTGNSECLGTTTCKSGTGYNTCR
jgi:hypothetical protein